MKKPHILMGILLGTTALQAQEPEKTATQLDRTVVVENLYNPDIMNANKINIMPTLEEPQVAKKQIEYATSTKPSKQFGFAPMVSFGETPQLADAQKGYLRLGYGNRGNVDGRLSYRLDLGKRDELNANLAFHGMDGSSPKSTALPAPRRSLCSRPPTRTSIRRSSSAARTGRSTSTTFLRTPSSW